MPLVNFGSVLGFALDIETETLEFLSGKLLVSSDAGMRDMAKELVNSSRKRIKEIERCRRENVTEMILENIENFQRSPFLLEAGVLESADPRGMAETTRAIIERAVRYYDAASEKLKQQSEVSRSLKTLAKSCRRDLSLIDQKNA